MEDSLAIIQFLAASLAAVGVIVVLVLALGFRGRAAIASEHDLQRLSARLGGARNVHIDAGGKSALALLSDGRVLAAKVMGNEISTRIFPKSAIAALRIHRRRRKRSLKVMIRFKDFSFPAIGIETADSEPPHWIEDLRPGVTAK